jgi:ATP-dependent Clp protease ATP-binding subunit ClpA
MERIVDKFIWQLEGQLAERKIVLELSAEARTLLAHEGYDEKFGARPLERVIQDLVKVPLGNEVLFGALVNGGKASIGVKKGKITVECSGNTPQSPTKKKTRKKVKA